MPRLLAERFEQTLFKLLNPPSQSNSALVRVGKVGLQGRPADAGPDAGRVRLLGFGGVDLFEQITVSVEEPAIDAGAAGDRADAALVGVVGAVVEAL